MVSSLAVSLNASGIIGKSDVRMLAGSANPLGSLKVILASLPLPPFATKSGLSPGHRLRGIYQILQLQMFSGMRTCGNLNLGVKYALKYIDSRTRKRRLLSLRAANPAHARR